MPLRYKQIHGNRDLSTICRLCVTHYKKNTSEILKIFTDSSKYLQTEITRVLQIQLFSGDGLPGYICKPCIEKLEFSSQFISCCVGTDDLLHKVATFIYEASSLDSQMHNISEETLMVFELINGNGGMSSLCRLCATQHKSNESKIFLSADNALRMQIGRVICLQPSEGDGLPDSICIACATNLDAAHNFITKSVYGDDLLRNVFFEGTEIEDVIKQEPKLEVDDASKPPLLEQEEDRQVSCVASPYAAEKFARDSTNSNDLLLNTTEQPYLMADSAQIHLTRKTSPIEARKRSSSVNTHACNLCKVNFDSKLLLKTHMGLHTVEFPFICRVCFNAYDNEKSLSVHECAFVHNGVAANHDCRDCKRSFGSKERLTTHMRAHFADGSFLCAVRPMTFPVQAIVKRRDRRQTEATPLDVHTRIAAAYICDICKISFGRKLHLEDHITQVHSREPPLSSADSQRQFTSEQSVAKHSHVRARSKLTHTCEVCKKTFSRKQRLSVHMRRHKSKAPLTCAICQLTFTEKKHLAMHIHVHAGAEVTHVCDICKLQVRSKRSLKSHMRVHRGERSFSCTVCPSSFTTDDQLSRHFREHTAAVSPFTCSICKKTLSSKQNLLNHMRLHAVKRQFSCTVCPKVYASFRKLSRHLCTHIGAEPSNFCNVCKKILGCKRTLTDHMRMHAVELRFSCTVCTKAFVSTGNLNRHYLKHPGAVPPYFQNVCKETLSSKQNLAHPKVSHTDKQSFPCTFCHKTFISKRILTRHKLHGHIGDKSPNFCGRSKIAATHICGVCQKSFLTKKGLTIHMLVHTGEKPFSCSVCNRRFALKGNLKKHTARKHSETD